MSCCGGNCGCGTSCGYSSGCSGCKMYLDLSYSEVAASTETLVLGVTYFDGESTKMGADNGCMCGANCTCDPYNCK